MASNEHKNLQDINLHNPKGFRGANNETVLSKGAGSSSEARDGILQWGFAVLLPIMVKLTSRVRGRMELLNYWKQKPVHPGPLKNC